MKYIVLFFFLLMLGLVMGQAVFAAPEQPPAFGGIGPAIPPGPQTGLAVFDMLKAIMNWIFVIVLVFAVIFIVLAGWQFITQGGNAQAVAEARMKLLWAAIGIGVVLLAQGALTVVKNILGV